MNKKGIFFTALAIVAISLFFVTYTFYEGSEKRESIKQRVETMNSFLESVKTDLSRQLYISGFRTIFILESKSIESGSYVTNIDSRFNESFFNGTYNQVSEPIFQDITFSEIETDIKDRAESLNINITLIQPNLIVTQENPWHVTLILYVNISMEDEAGLASWKNREKIQAQIPVDKFEDLVYIIQTNGKVTNKIKRSNYTTFASGTDVSNLTKHSSASLYISSSSAPSFLNRLQGNLSADSNGIESLVNLQNLSQQGISIEDKSVVDYIYFSNNNPTSYKISGMPSWFRIDSAHLDIYNVSGLTL